MEFNNLIVNIVARDFLIAKKYQKSVKQFFEQPSTEDMNDNA